MNTQADTNASTTTETPATGSPAGKPAKPSKPRKPAAKRASSKPTKAAKPAKTGAKLVKSGDGASGTPLKTLLAKLKLPADGRAARRKLRAAGFTWHDPKSRWNLTAKQLQQAEAVLRGDE